jgi:hypothetical protein
MGILSRRVPRSRILHQGLLRSAASARRCQGPEGGFGGPKAIDTGREFNQTTGLYTAGEQIVENLKVLARIVQSLDVRGRTTVDPEVVAV